MAVNLKPREQCKWDATALGETMLRLDPGDGRIRTTRTFQVWEGGGEYNVARGLRCFGLRTTMVTAIGDNEIDRLLEDLMLQGGVDLSHVKWAPFDGIGRAARVGLNLTEKGFGVRAAVGCSDRAWSAASQLKPGDVDWKQLFEVEGVRWFHCRGYRAALPGRLARRAAARERSRPKRRRVPPNVFCTPKRSRRSRRRTRAVAPCSSRGPSWNLCCRPRTLRAEGRASRPGNG
jgi:sugar/nucleoside kinase (ribokinase family)